MRARGTATAGAAGMSGHMRSGCGSKRHRPGGREEKFRRCRLDVEVRAAASICREVADGAPVVAPAAWRQPS